MNKKSVKKGDFCEQNYDDVWYNVTLQAQMKIPLYKLWELAALSNEKKLSKFTKHCLER